MESSAIVPRLRLGLIRTFSALKHRNYQLWFAGQLVSLMGTWMQINAQGFLIYDLTKSTVYLGTVSFAAGLPTFILMLFGGVLADRFSRRSLMLVTQTCMLILAAVLAGLVFTRVVQPWHILVLAVLLGIANTFDTPARVALVSELVPREDMTNAIALNATMFNSAAFVGPAIAGLTYNWFGPGWCFTINAISFLAVIAALLMMKLPKFAPPIRSGSTLKQLLEGFRYVRQDRLTLTLTLNMGLISLFAGGLFTLLPAWAVNVLGGDAQTNGLLQSARGLGSLVGALLLAALSHRKLRGKLWTLGGFGLPIGMALLALSRQLVSSLLSLAGIGWSFISQANTSNALVQARVPDALRGRVMSIYTLVFFGGMPLGSLGAGFAAARLNEPGTALVSAVCLMVLASLIWLFLPAMRSLE